MKKIATLCGGPGSFQYIDSEDTTYLHLTCLIRHAWDNPTSFESRDRVRLNPSPRSIPVQSPVVKEMGPLILVIILIGSGGAELAWSSSI